MPLGGGRSAPIEVEPLGWQYKTGSFFAPVVGEGVAARPGAGALIVHLTQSAKSSDASAFVDSTSFSFAAGISLTVRSGLVSRPFKF